MKYVVAHSRCEVSGTPYNPGEKFYVTEAQLAFLKANNAVSEIPMQNVSRVQLEPGISTEEADRRYFGLVGKHRPKKEKHK